MKIPKAYQWIFVVSDGMNQNQIKNGQRLNDPTLTCTCIYRHLLGKTNTTGLH